MPAAASAGAAAQLGAAVTTNRVLTSQHALLVGGAGDRGDHRAPRAGRVILGIELWQRLHRARQRTRGVIAWPYQGLAVFDADDAERFSGRERLVAALVARLATAPLPALVGASGSGDPNGLLARAVDAAS